MTRRRVHQIAPPLARLATAVATLHPHEGNPRHGNVDAITESLYRFGQLKPIVVQKSTSTIVAGNHTYAAAVQLGWTHIAAAVIDLDDLEAKAYLLADNRLSDLAENDDDALAAILAKLQDDGKLEGTGFTVDEVDDLLAQLALLPTAEVAPAFTPAENENKSPYDPDNPNALSTTDRVSGAGQMPHREIVLVLTTEQADLFGADIKRLSRVYDTQGIASTVLAATKDAVKHAGKMPA